MFLIFKGNCNIPNEDDKWNVGSGASMYVNASQEPWNKHYQMFTYITDELHQLVLKSFPVIQDKISIFGHRYIYINNIK